MANELTQLPRTNFTGLDFNNIIEDLTRLVIDNPDYNDNWEDFLSSNAGRMMMELFAYIADSLSTRIDWMVNENFIGTATQKKSIIRILKLIGYNFELPYSAEVPVTVSLDRPIGNFFLTPVYSSIAGTLTPFTISAQDKNGNSRTYEAITYDSINKRYEYKVGVEIQSGDATNPNLTNTVNFYEGKTIIQNFTAETDNNPIFTLSQNPVTENSIRVYSLSTSGSSIIETELNRVISFLDPEAQKEQDDFGNDYQIPYILNVLENDTVSIEFGPTALLPNSNRRLTIGDQIRVFYRTGGGENGNLTRRSISTTRNLSFGGELVNITFRNDVQGSGGKDAETSQEAVNSAPLLVRTVNKTVTAEDYDIILNAESTVVKSKSYGNNNFPPNLFSLYGEYIKPLDVWNFVLKDQPGWEDASPSRYNDFQWFELRLENRFNEPIAFSNGSFNSFQNFESTSINQGEYIIDYDGDGGGPIRNYISIQTIGLSDVVRENGSINSDLQVKISADEVSDNYFYLIDEDNIFVEKYTNNEGLIEGDAPTLQIYEPRNARYFSSINIDGNVDFSSNYNTKLSFDNRPALEVDLTGSVPASTTPTEIRDAINAAFLNSVDYNNGTTGTKGTQTLGLDENASDPAGFNLGTDIYFRVNAIEYSFNTGDTLGQPTFAQMALLMNEAFSLTIKGDLVNGQAEIRNVTNGTILKRIKKGWRVSGLSVTGGTVITEVNRATGVLTLDQVAIATDTQQEIKIYPFWAEVTGTSPNQDITITNLQEEPVGPVWIENGTNPVADFNLFTNSGFSAFSSAPGAQVDSSGVAGYHDFGLNAALEDTYGFQTFAQTFASASDSNGAILGQDYDFQVEVDGSNPWGDLNVIIAGGTTVGDLVANINTTFTGASPSAVPATASFDTEVGKIKITSDTTGSASTVSILDPATPGTDGSLILDLLGDGDDVAGGGVDDAVDGTDGETELTVSTAYYLTINGVEFSITTGGTAPITYADLISLLDSALAPYYSVTLETNSEWDKDIRITNETTGWVNLEKGTSGTDLFDSLTGLHRLSGIVYSMEDWSEFDNPVGGGDYSAVAKNIIVPLTATTEQYIYLESPSFEELSSIVVIDEADSNSSGVNVAVFGLDTAGNGSFTNYGYHRATLISDASREDFAEILYENGSVRFDTPQRNFYTNYLYTNEDTIFIGDYRNTEFDEEDPAWRIPATRVYNTVYSDSTSEIDVVNSDFQLRFTDDTVDTMSLFAIESDWSITEAEPAKVSSVSGFLSSLDSSNYLIRVNVDNVNPVVIDVTGDAGASAGGAGYSIEQVVDNINSEIRSASGYNGVPVYGSFNYAQVNVDGDSFTIISPTNTNVSRIELTNPAASPNLQDATDVIFGLSTALIPPSNTYSHIFRATGDFYIAYHTEDITGDFISGDSWITDISNTDLDKIEVGMRFLAVPSVMEACYVLEKDESGNRIRVTLEALSSSNDQNFQVSLDKMTLNKIINPNQQSTVPDLQFYVHYIFDKRLVEGIFDGETLNGVKRPGFIDGSLDEDVFEAILENKKIVGINNVFKQTKFSTFDLVGTVYHDKVFSGSDVKQNVEKALREEFFIENREFGSPVARSKVMSVIHSVPGVDYVEIDYLGIDATTPSSNVGNTISATFDEVIIISEDIIVAGQQTHGIDFEYRISGT